MAGRSSTNTSLVGIDTEMLALAQKVHEKFPQLRQSEIYTSALCLKNASATLEENEALLQKIADISLALGQSFAETHENLAKTSIDSSAQK